MCCLHMIVLYSCTSFISAIVFCYPLFFFIFFFFFNDTATTEIYTLSLHDALPISGAARVRARSMPRSQSGCAQDDGRATCMRWKSTRLNSSHSSISYAVFCLKKKKKKKYKKK